MSELIRIIKRLSKAKAAVWRQFKLMIKWVERGFSNCLKEYQLIKDIWLGKFPGFYPESYKKMSLSIIEKAFLTVFIFIRSLSLGSIIIKFVNSYKIRTEIPAFYVLVWIFGLLWLLWHPLPSTPLMVLVAGYSVIEALNYPICVVFVDRYKRDWGIRSLNRSLLLVMLNYCEIIIGFAILYLATRSIGYSNSNEIITRPIEAVYFSVATITTMDYGDITPICSLGKTLALSEPLVGFVLIVFIIGVFLSGVRGIKEKAGGD